MKIKWSIVMVVVLLVVILALLYKNRSGGILDLETYSNPNQGFEIGLPPSSTSNIDIDAESFYGGFESDEGISLLIRKNFNSEITPPFLPDIYPACKTEGMASVSNKYLLPFLAFSSSENGIDQKCVGEVKSAHTVFTRFCVSPEGVAYHSEPSTGGSEGSYECRDQDPEYDINILCEGEKWQGLAGRDKCITLYTRILGSFKTSNR